jgi:hypothetical protein
MPVPDVAAIDPASREFVAWSRSQRLTGRDLAVELESQVVCPPPSGDGRTIGTLYAYRNATGDPDRDWNTAGTAAIATIADFHDRDPYRLPRPVRGPDGRVHWDTAAVVDAIVAAGYGPDVVFGWGTTGGRITDALRSYGLTADVGYSGLFAAGWERQWRVLRAYLERGLPVPVLVDLGAFPGGRWYAPHWAIAYARVDGVVRLANCRWARSADDATFLRAWHCWYLPYGFNHCAVYAF